MMAEFTQPVDLLAGPLWVSALFKLAAEHFIWYHRSHHIIMDGFSGGIMARRVASLYTALVEKRPVSDDDALESLSVLFEEDKAYRNSSRYLRDREYWMQRFANQTQPRQSCHPTLTGNRQPDAAEFIPLSRQRG